MFSFLYLISTLMCAIGENFLDNAVLDSTENEKTLIEASRMFATFILLV